jgi:hypothetical protein
VRRAACGVRLAAVGAWRADGGAWRADGGVRRVALPRTLTLPICRAAAFPAVSLTRAMYGAMIDVNLLSPGRQ